MHIPGSETALAEKLHCNITIIIKTGGRYTLLKTYSNSGPSENLSFDSLTVGNANKLSSEPKKGSDMYEATSWIARCLPC